MPTKKEQKKIEESIESSDQSVKDVEKAISAAPTAKAPVAHAPGPITEEEPAHSEDEAEKLGDENGDSESGDEGKECECTCDGECKCGSKSDEAEEGEEGEEGKEGEESENEVDMEEDVNALMNGEANLTEGFKSKAKTIFEAAVKSKLRAARKELHEDYQRKLTDKAEEIMSTVTEQVDSYLTYVVESWMKENQVAIDSTLRTEIAEGFITSLKNVFAESYIEVPKADKDLVESLNSRIVELQEQVKEAAQITESTKLQNEKLLRKSIIAEATKGLAITQASRLNELTKDVVFESVEAFTKKVATIKESYFSGKAPQSGTSTPIVKSTVKPQVVKQSGSMIVEGQEDPNMTVSNEMKQYLSAISRVQRGNPNRKP